MSTETTYAICSTAVPGCDFDNRTIYGIVESNLLVVLVEMLLA
jgi:hypothetical protein